MRIREIANILKAQIICGENKSDTDIKSACACDIMSDVMTFVKDQSVLLTGCNNPQVVRAVVAMDMKAIVFVRGKKPDEKTIELAKQYGIILLTTNYKMFVASGLLFANGLSGGNAV